MSLTPIADFVRDYAASDTSRLHMPGHKGRGPLGCEGLDITEIAGADELYEAEGIIARSEANTARLFGSAGSWYGTEGSSQCIRAMVFLALQAAPKGSQRPVLLAARNAHKALLYAAALLDIDVEWLWPPEGPDASLCACPVSPAALTAALDKLEQAGRRPFGVYLTSPDYLGGVQDIAALAPVCHGRGIPLLVDNAHGAYLRFLPGGSRHPLDLGADLCCDSAHKTLPVLTGGAYLHAGHGLLRPAGGLRRRAGRPEREPFRPVPRLCSPLRAVETGAGRGGGGPQRLRPGRPVPHPSGGVRVRRHPVSGADVHPRQPAPGF